MPVFSEQVDLRLGRVLAYAVLLVLFLLNTVTLSLPISGAFEIPFILMAIYYWGVYRPTLIPVWMVFAAGIVFDLLSAAPLGLNAFIYVVLRWVVVDQRLFLASQSFLTVWIGYVVVSLMAIIVQWAVFGLINLGWPPFFPALSMFTAGVFLYPLISFALHLSHRLLPSLQDHYG